MSEETEIDRSFFSRVVGESFRNDDGTDRQTILSLVTPGMPVELVREPRNKFDSDAVAVVVPGLGQIGYLPRDHCLADQIKAGTVRASVRGVHGGSPEKPSRGASLQIDIVSGVGASPRPPAPPKTAEDWSVVRSFRCRLVDTDAVNVDGAHRQDLLAKVAAGVTVELECDEDHVSDFDAVSVRAPGLGIIGYLREGHDIALDVSLGCVRATVARVEGGTAKKPLRGAMIAIDVLDTPRDGFVPKEYEPHSTAAIVVKPVAAPAASPTRRSALKTAVVWTGIVAVGLATLQVLFGGAKRPPR